VYQVYNCPCGYYVYIFYSSYGFCEVAIVSWILCSRERTRNVCDVPTVLVVFISIFGIKRYFAVVTAVLK